MTKHDLLEDFIDNMTDDDLYSLWGECASEGVVDYIESTDDIDELWTPSRILECNLDEFNIRDRYYICDYDTLISYDWMNEAIDDLDEMDNLIDWIIDGNYDGWDDELKEFLDSEEYKEAE